MFEWDMARLVAKNGHQKDMCYNENEIDCSKSRHHPKFDSRYDWKGLYNHFKRKRIGTLSSSNFFSQL